MDSHLLQKMVGQTLELADEWESEEFQEATSAPLPGVFYDVELGRGTFCLRGDARFQEESDRKSGKNFFATSRLELAEVIADQLFNRRFPLEEDELCNISDPGGSWWMGREGRKVHIFFGGHYSDEKVNLGPLGDVAVAHSLFKRGESWLRRLLPIEELFLSPKYLALSALDSEHDIFQQFCDIFLKGEKPDHPSFGTSALSLYLEELAVVRRFWLCLQENVILRSLQDF